MVVKQGFIPDGAGVRYFEKRNVHFYVSRCRIHVAAFFNSHRPDPNDSKMAEHAGERYTDGMFHFVKEFK